jgi:hypothetical protein
MSDANSLENLKAEIADGKVGAFKLAKKAKKAATKAYIDAIHAEDAEELIAQKRQQETIQAFGGTKASTKPPVTQEGLETELSAFAQDVAKKKIGRPSKYSAAIAQEICEGLAEGTPLREICRRDHMPEWRTVYDWMGRDDSLSTAIAHARDIGYDKMAEECLQIADTPVEGRKIVETDDGKVMYTREDMLGHRKLQIETRLKLLAKFNPKKYGDRAILAGDADNPLQINIQATEMFESILKNAEMTRQIEE